MCSSFFEYCFLIDFYDFIPYSLEVFLKDGDNEELEDISSKIPAQGLCVAMPVINPDINQVHLWT